MPKKKRGGFGRKKATGFLLMLSAAVIIALAISASIYQNSLQQTVTVNPPLPTPTPISATYKCNGAKSIQAKFYSNSVNLSLSDGRKMSLPSAISADGARYANTNESIVFWNAGKTAFIEENKVQTYQNCLENK